MVPLDLATFPLRPGYAPRLDYIAQCCPCKFGDYRNSGEVDVKNHKPVEYFYI